MPAEDIHHLHEGARQIEQLQEGVVLADGIEQIQWLVRLEPALGSPLGVDAPPCRGQRGHFLCRQNARHDQKALVLELAPFVIGKPVLKAGIFHRCLNLAAL